MKKYIMVSLLCLCLLTGCSKQSNTITGQINEIVEGGYNINCSEEVNKGEKNVNDIGYGCFVQVNDETVYKGQNDSEIIIEEISQGDVVTVKLTKAVRFSNLRFNKPLGKELIAEQITLQN